MNTSYAQNRVMNERRFYMKRKCKNIDITNIEFIEKAIIDCLSGKKKTRQDIASIMNKHNDNVHEIALEMQSELVNRKLNLKPIWYKRKYDDASRKWRTIGIQDIKQQMYDYIAVNAMADLIPCIGKYQCASIKGRGQLYCKNAIYNHIQKKDAKYACKFDIKKYYESVNHDDIMAWLRKRIKNEMLLWLIDVLLKTFKLGLSIGSYLSQTLANLYLSDLYHKIEQIHTVRRGKKRKVVLFQAFYMDDILIIGSNSRELIKVGNMIVEECANKGLSIKPNWRCFEIESSFIDMVGYRIYKDHVTLRRCNMKKSRRAVIRYSHKPKNIHLARRVLSYSGMIKYSDSVLFCIKYNIHKYVKKARKVVSNYDKAKIRLQVA